VPPVTVRLPERLQGDDGLLLRRLCVADAELLAAAVTESLEHLRPWMPWIVLEPLSLPTRRTMLAEREREWLDGGDVMLGIFVGDRLTGGCGLHRRIAPDGLELGYWVHPAWVRRGIATRTARLLTAATLAQPGISHAEIHTDAANLASAAVARRCGYVLAGVWTRPPRAPGESGTELRWRASRPDAG
jgi:ribosomal-protein-serine acetyltransferase